jgi:hypothetical protein
VIKEKKETILIIDTRGTSDRKKSIVDSDNDDSEDQEYLDYLGKAIQVR